MLVHTQSCPLVQGSCVRVKHLHLERITTFFPRLRGFGKPLTLRFFLHPRCRLALLLPVSDGWGAGTVSRFEPSELKARIDLINAEGVVTLDTPLVSQGRSQSYPRDSSKLGDEIEQITDGKRSL